MDKIDFVNSTHPALNDENLNRMQDNIERAINAQVSGDTLPIGALMPFSSDTIPENWLLCDGREIDREEYSQLFAVIGTKYGQGDGSTTFNLPDMRGRVAVGQDIRDTDLDRLGKNGGEKKHTLTINEMPSHSHMTRLDWSDTRGDGIVASYQANSNARIDSGTITSYEGGSQPHNIMQPYSVQNYIIKAFQSSGTVANIVNNYSESTSDTYSCKYVNSITNYSKNEIKIGKWINGESIYRKVIELDIIPSRIGIIEIPHYIQNVDFFTNITGFINNGTEQIPFNSVYRAVDNTNYDLGILADRTHIIYTTKTDRSSYTGIVILEYVKSS